MNRATRYSVVNSCLTTRIIVNFKNFKHKIALFKATVCTHGEKNLHALLVKHYNDLLDGQSSEWSIDKVTYFYVGDLFCIHLGTKYANFQEKIFADISGRKFQTLYSSNFINAPLRTLSIKQVIVVLY